MVANDDALADERVRAQPILQDCGRDIFPTGGHDELFLAASDLDETFVVDLTDVSGVEPAVHDRLARGRVVVPIALVNVLTGHQNLAVVCDPDGDPGGGTPDGADFDVGGGVDGAGGSRLGQPVALEDGHADAAEEVAESRTERCSARDRPRDLAAHGCPQFDVDELVEKTMLKPEQQSRAAGIERFAIRDRDGLRAIEDLALAIGMGALLGGVVNLLEHPGDGQNEGRLERRKVREQVFDVGGVAHSGAGLHTADLDEPGEDVGQGQEQQGRPLGVEQFREDGACGATGSEQVAVR